jgi:hypothetical protein
MNVVETRFRGRLAQEELQRTARHGNRRDDEQAGLNHNLAGDEQGGAFDHVSTDLMRSPGGLARRPSCPGL